MTTITHIASGQTLTGKVGNQGTKHFYFAITGDTHSTAYYFSAWRIEPEPRTLPTHVGAMVVKPGTTFFWRLRDGIWTGPKGRALDSNYLLEELGPDWVELVPKSDTPTVDREAVIAETVAAIAISVNNNCTPSSEAYTRGGDALIVAVAEWIGSPPEFITSEWARVVRAAKEARA